MSSNAYTNMHESQHGLIAIMHAARDETPAVDIKSRLSSTGEIYNTILSLYSQPHLLHTSHVIRCNIAALRLD